MSGGTFCTGGHPALRHRHCCHFSGIAILPLVYYLDLFVMKHDRVAHVFPGNFLQQRNVSKPQFVPRPHFSRKVVWAPDYLVAAQTIEAFPVFLERYKVNIRQCGEMPGLCKRKRLEARFFHRVIALHPLRSRDETVILIRHCNAHNYNFTIIIPINHRS